MFACKKGYTEIVKLLLEQKGIDINYKHDGWSALIWASKNGHTEIVKSLLEQEGIDVNVKGHHEKTPLWYATKKGQIEVVKLLLKQKGINVNAYNYKNYDSFCFHNFMFISIYFCLL